MVLLNIFILPYKIKTMIKSYLSADGKQHCVTIEQKVTGTMEIEIFPKKIKDSDKQPEVKKEVVKLSKEDFTLNLPVEKTEKVVTKFSFTDEDNTKFRGTVIDYI